MEEKNETKILDEQKMKDVNGGAAKYSGGYCPFTTDRNCKVEAVGNFDPENEDCKTCGWRAW